MPTVRKNTFKNMEIHSFFGPFPCFPVHFLESAKKPESIILQTKNFPRRLLILCYVEFSQNVDWQMINDYFAQNEDSKFSLNMVFRIAIIA